jgi:hypothetical protein
VLQAIDTSWLTPARIVPLLTTTNTTTTVKIAEPAWTAPVAAGKSGSVDLRPSSKTDHIPTLATTSLKKSTSPSCNAHLRSPSGYAPTLRKEFRMASGCVYGPALPSPTHRMSISTSPGTSTSSSESPRTTTNFDFSVRYMNGNGTRSPRSPSGDDVVPKVEELEDDDAIDPKIKSPSDERDSAEPPALLNGDGTIARRPRGRPRKHPKSLTTAISKPPKGRSKTGCITCRRRKKKCDEKKPECMSRIC